MGIASKVGNFIPLRRAGRIARSRSPTNVLRPEVASPH